jgi:hypothetical protein
MARLSQARRFAPSTNDRLQMRRRERSCPHMRGGLVHLAEQPAVPTRCRRPLLVAEDPLILL